MREKIVLEVREADVRLDAYIASNSGLSRSAAVKLIEEKGVLVNQKEVSKKYIVRENDIIEVILPEVKEIEAKAEKIPLDIVYEDEYLLVINKPSGMVVHPAAGNYEGTLVNALLYYCKDELSGINGEQRPGIVHRIDKDTSGLLVVAKTDEAHKRLSEQLSEHKIVREYHALVNGGFSADEGTVDLPIGRSQTDRKKMAVIRDGRKSRNAVTHYKVLERFGRISYLSLKLETGRTHQIRVHMSALGHSLLGDLTYGGGRTTFEKKHAPLLS
ncbi:MAG: RluA family pseudouridine synthase, partial [Clostridia bacterium]|nr:RluA family pseudouridine synthase [Clostridia bacterium]